MATKEQRLTYQPFVQASKGRLKLKRIENSVGEAMPDTICQNRKGTTFWLENKYLDNWPVRESTLPLRTSFQKGQLGFARDWNSWKGHAYILIRVKDDFILLNPFHALDAMTKDELLSLATLVIGKENIVKYLEQL